MPAIYVGHAPADAEVANILKDWLAREEFDSCSSARTKPKADAPWSGRLATSVRECEVAIFCWSDNALKSQECLRDFLLAEQSGRSILPLQVGAISAEIPRFLRQIQWGKLSPDLPEEDRDDIERFLATKGVLPRRLRYRAFISYSHGDLSFARSLQERLERVMIPAAAPEAVLRFSPVFRDEMDLAAGALTPRLQRALESSEALIVIASPAAAKSEWVNREIDHFQRTNKGRPLLAILAPRPTGLSHAACFPASLTASEVFAPDVMALGEEAAVRALVAGALDISPRSLP